MSSHDSCLACPPGQFCKGEALSLISGNCSAGFYCILGAAVESPANGSTGAPCPKGHYCPTGAAAPLPCGNGFYQDLERESSCKICPAGFYCNITELGGSVTPQPCPAGHFCPKGSASGTMRRCPCGTYSPDRQLRAEG
ncbi:signal peptide, CUB and EGF-like domain-containing protein 1 [Rana temporaria]|uniref:signal peptide, CUB and EGF-like domain-containing protein 1 n=1 Tax=Rana temporaria TaxID=8407 RepID=UPI001AACE482|nr:signal peptide, CUB and EGF-like domain-containing protein 1 [Rana temporaria]